MVAIGLPIIIVVIFLFAGFFVVNPNEARALVLFGKYGGSVKTDGFHWANPLYRKRKISLRVRNFESTKLKVNDLEGNPIEIAAVVVWRVFETAEALFEVDNYEHYVKVQTEAAVRNLATQYPYDAHIDGPGVAARQHDGDCREAQGRGRRTPREGRRRSARGADQPPRLLAGDRRRRCCSGSRPARSSRRGRASSKAPSGWSRWRSTCCRRAASSTLDNERKAAMVSNLLVVLCGHRGTQPVVNTGTIYQ